MRRFHSRKSDFFKQMLRFSRRDGIWDAQCLEISLKWLSMTENNVKIHNISMKFPMMYFHKFFHRISFKSTWNNDISLEMETLGRCIINKKGGMAGTDYSLCHAHQTCVVLSRKWVRLEAPLFVLVVPAFARIRPFLGSVHQTVVPFLWRTIK